MRQDVSPAPQVNPPIFRRAARIELLSAPARWDPGGLAARKSKKGQSWSNSGPLMSVEGLIVVRRGLFLQ